MLIKIIILFGITNELIVNISSQLGLYTLQMFLVTVIIYYLVTK